MTALRAGNNLQFSFKYICNFENNFLFVGQHTICEDGTFLNVSQQL